MPTSFLNKFNNLNNMLKEFNEILSDNYWKNFDLEFLNNNSFIQTSFEIWESDKEYKILLFSPGLSQEEQVDVSFKNNSLISIKVELTAINDKEHPLLVASVFPRKLEEEIKLPSPVLTDNFLLNINNNILSIVLSKQVKDLEIPIDY